MARNKVLKRQDSSQWEMLPHIRLRHFFAAFHEVELMTIFSTVHLHRWGSWTFGETAKTLLLLK